MRDDAPGATLQLFRSQAIAVRSNRRDPTRRIEGTVSPAIFKRLARDMADETGIEGWRAFAEAPELHAATRTGTALSIDNVTVFVWRDCTGIDIRESEWPESTFGND